MPKLIGIEAIEGTANVQNTQNNIPSRNIGILMERERGVENKPIQIVNNKADKLLFGEHNKTRAYSSYVVESFFNNLAGATPNLIGIRIVGALASAAEATVANSTPANVFTVKAGRYGEEDKGDWANNNVTATFYPAGVPGGLTDKESVKISFKGTEIEMFKADTLAKLAERVNAGSNYILMEEIDYSLGITVATTATLTGGVYAAPTESDLIPHYNAVTGVPEGMALFEKTSVNIIACPEVFTTTFAVACKTFGEIANMLFVNVMLEDAAESDVITMYNAVKDVEQSWIGNYLNWSKVDDGDGGTVWIPATGYFLGAGYARVAYLDGNVVWSVPAGDRTYAKGVVEFSHDELTEATVTKYATQYATNCVYPLENIGSSIWTQRTASLNVLYESIHVRLETDWLVKKIKARHVRFKDRINTTSLRKDIYTDLFMFFKGLYNQGGIENSVAFENAVIITVETEPNNRKGVEIELSWIPPENVEHIITKLNRNDGALIVA